MKIINHDTTNLLFEKAEELSQEPHESWKCVHFKFADRPERNNHALYANFVVNPIIGLLSNNTGFVYLCDDSDIVILYQGTLKSIVSKLSNHFGEIDPEHPRQSNDNMIEFFDLSHDWNEFHNLCANKYYRRIVMAEAKRSRFAPVHITPRAYTTSTN